ncbi:hypothetical protein ACIBF5_30230 [Micromonospora sp. NPDC050417]|uniref:immunity protein Imm33 domain-containing protein n=1 Tax=Micromonospora sp. NPDC050417 TaxID=3364280 RepID=UPI0037AE3BA5
MTPHFPARGTMIGVALSRRRDLVPLHALRHPVSGQGNGWFVWRGSEIPQDEDDFFATLHVAHLRDHAPELMPYLALPPGWRVLLAPGHEDVWYDPDLLAVQPG